VIIPAFGATDEDKKKLIRKGIRVAQYDATCMLVEKVWKAARTLRARGLQRRHPRQGRARGDQGHFFEHAALRPGDHREEHVFAEKFGPEGPGEAPRVGGQGRNDTLCYATQVNQDALTRALAEPLDAAFVIGGKNSSNSYQLYRLCEQRLGPRAFFIQSETNILSPDEAEHYVFPAKGAAGQGGHLVRRPLWSGAGAGAHAAPRRILVTGGASCPDGIIQQVISRINSFYPPDALRDIEAVLADLAG
jgi:4-hydroxy-3-methylbut-2-enyl diphosphate reductase IspH